MPPEGLMMMNVYDVARDRELLMSIVATLHRVFPTVLVYASVPKSYMLFAFAEQRPLSGVRAALEHAQGDPGVVRLAQAAALGIGEIEPPPGTQPFTDDRAPIEPLTRRMLAQDIQ
jgi:hypothetical protein